jgi:hypothetical protein
MNENIKEVEAHIEEHRDIDDMIFANESYHVSER